MTSPYAGPTTGSAQPEHPRHTVVSAAESIDMRIRPLDQPGDLGWIVWAHGEIYAKEYDFDTTFEALVARIVADFANEHDPTREVGWIAEVNGQRAGCVLCVTDDESDAATAKVRTLLVDPAARGHSVGAGLVDACLDFAREVGYRRVTLWSTDTLASARRIYQSRGFELVHEEPHHSFGHDLVGQHWTLNLDHDARRG